jgi:catechol 2,3-dioxygenase-like lactoylglutathione lyase family enzyme
VRLLAATMPCSDPEGLTEWYRQTLGAGPPVTFVAGEATPHHFAFHVRDLGAWRDRLEVPLIRGEHGLDEFDFSNWGGARAIYFADPEGNIAELIARPQPRPELSLAEVGLPVEDVATAVEALERELVLPHYDGDRETFSAVGDDDGLLIVVDVGRGWFPPRVPAGRAPIAVTIAGGPRRSLELPGSDHVVASI